MLELAEQIENPRPLWISPGQPTFCRKCVLRDKSNLLIYLILFYICLANLKSASHFSQQIIIFPG
jgi:hypothetical protein